jgi:hypothetical protein
MTGFFTWTAKEQSSEGILIMIAVASVYQVPTFIQGISNKILLQQ